MRGKKQGGAKSVTAERSLAPSLSRGAKGPASPRGEGRDGGLKQRKAISNLEKDPNRKNRHPGNDLAQNSN